MENVSILRNYSRTLHIAFVLLSLYYLILRNDVDSATSNLGISLIFDPFHPSVKWQDRPLIQKLWLLLIVGLTITGIVNMFLQ